jgi:hypothetical protein
MSKSKTNALDALRALIAERQQYDQWISTLESKRDRTPEHVFNRVYSDYRSRLDRVVGEIRGHAEELQLSIATLSSRLGEVAKDEEAKRDAMSEAELRAAVGEYDAAQWESMQADSKRQLDKIAADRASLEGQLAELDSIRKLSEVTAPSVEVGAGASPDSEPRAEPPRADGPKPEKEAPPEAARAAEPASEGPSTFVRADRNEEPPKKQFSDAGWPARETVEQSSAAAARAEPAAVKQGQHSRPFSNRTGAIGDQPGDRGDRESVQASSPPAPAPPSTAAPRISANMDAALAEPRPSATPVPAPRTPTPPRNKRHTPTGKDEQISSGFSKPIRTPADARPEVNKTLKCPECGTANYPTEWYCERCGGELATM